ncbi:MAG: hypothetical protein JWP89_1960 [Schlesneria sp.]|nr:hypothetical protein [Schlesneria sp.]
MNGWMLLAQMEEPTAVMSGRDTMMLVVNGVALILIVWLIFRVIRRSGSLQSRALVQIERSLQHMDKAEQFMAMQEKQGDRIIKLLELIDRNVRRSPG